VVAITPSDGRTVRLVAHDLSDEGAAELLQVLRRNLIGVVVRLERIERVRVVGHIRA
jgi:hypothetical protein